MKWSQLHMNDNLDIHSCGHFAQYILHKQDGMSLWQTKFKVTIKIFNG